MEHAGRAKSTQPAPPRASAGHALLSSPTQRLHSLLGNQALMRLLSTQPPAQRRRDATHEPITGREDGALQASNAPPSASVLPRAPTRIQRRSATDARLPVDQAEAIVYARETADAIRSARQSLAASPDARRRNTQDLLRQTGLQLVPLTPRHDSTPSDPSINFFVGTVDYTTSVLMPSSAEYHLDINGSTLRIRARDMLDADLVESTATVEDRIVQGITELAYLAPLGAARGNLFERYRARFNALFESAAFNGFAANFNAFDPALDSKGPRTQRARAVFARIYGEDATLRAAYDANTAGIRERIDSYVGPEGFNLLNSPRLQALRGTFDAFTAPVSGANVASLKAAIATATTSLTDQERDAVAASNDWQRLLNAYFTAESERQQIRVNIATRPPAPPPPAPPPSPPGPPPPAPAGGATPQAFIDAIRIAGPAGPVLANGRVEPVRFTPQSSVANPSVPISTRITVTPADRVQGSNASPASVWPDAVLAGVAFWPTLTNTATVNFTAHLDLVNGPAGLQPTTPVPDLTFSLQDNRRAHFIGSWRSHVQFNAGGGQAFFRAGASVRYRSGAQNFVVQADLPGGRTNPGLPLFVRTRLRRGTSAADPLISPEQVVAFPADANGIPNISLAVAAPATVPVSGDPMFFQIDLLDSDRTTVLGSRPIALSVLPEVTYTKARAQAAAVADRAFFYDTSASGLLGIMTAAGGIAARLAAALTPSPDGRPGLIRIEPLTVRHDSAEFLTRVEGSANPGRVGYFAGVAYGDPPDASRSFAAVAGAAAFRTSLSAFPGRLMVMNRTTDVATNAKRGTDSIIMLAIHEAVHALDERPGADTEIERYKTEFRAYWMDGRYGPPERALCAPADGAQCKNAAFDASLPPPGPKSPRAREIFRGLYGSVTYPFVKPAYDNNTSGFREAVDNYLFPDGINLIIAPRLERLRALIAGGVTPSFAAFQNRVRSFVGVGAAPAGGVLDAAERDVVARNRAWRELVNSHVPVPAQNAQIKADLGIPI